MTLTRIRYHGPGFENELHARNWEEGEMRQGDELIVWVPTEVLGPCHGEEHRTEERLDWIAGWSRYRDDREVNSDFWITATLPQFLHRWPTQIHDLRDEFLKALSELGVLDAALQKNTLQK
jgi:hypothetical protein